MICPCCGVKTKTDLSEGCDRCGAVAVGPPLAPPKQLLPSFGAAASGACLGSLALAALLGATIVALIEEKSLLAANLGDIIGAAETAAWRLKFIIAPAAVGVAWWSARTYFKIRSAPARWTGREMSLVGFASSCTALVLVAALIGVTVPVRIAERQLAQRVKSEVPLRTFNRVLTQYRIRYGTHAADIKDLEKLPDPDGSIAKLLAEFPLMEYSASAQKASLPAAQAKKMRAPRLRQINLRDTVDDADGERISFTNYALRLPGDDGLLNTADDLVMRDGITGAAEESSIATESPTPISRRFSRVPANR